MTRRRFDPSLYFVTDHRLPFPQLIDVVAAAVEGGVTLVQYRNPGLGTRKMVEEAAALKALLESRGLPLIVNDRVDVALAVGAAGVHVGQSDMPALAARRLMGSEAILGQSITEFSQLADIDPETVDYLGVGPVFATATKKDAAPALGLKGTAAIAAASPLPSVAIGGIHLANAADVAATGIAGLSVVSALSQAPNPMVAASALRAIARAFSR